MWVTSLILNLVQLAIIISLLILTRRTEKEPRPYTVVGGVIVYDRDKVDVRLEGNGVYSIKRRAELKDFVATGKSPGQSIMDYDEEIERSRKEYFERTGITGGPTKTAV